MKTKIEYVWLDGYISEPNLRSKIKIIDYTNPSRITLGDIPNWGFDGSSTKQAEGNFSDCYLKPIKLYRSDNNESDTIYVLCEVLDGDNNTHDSNTRALIGDEDIDFWVGFEQEYFIRKGHNQNILGFNGTIIDPQGKYYCGVGGQMHGRHLSDEHLDMCLKYGINIEGTNAEVAIGQWEYQIFGKGKISTSDDLWMSRYFLYKLAEKYGYQIDLHPKPIQIGEWNGSGLHTNFSNKKMREVGGEEYFNSIFKSFSSRTKEHIDAYGSDNHLRLTGKYETQSIDRFSWGFSDRGASIRVPKMVSENWTGYLEDRRPASHADPYRIVKVISDTLKFADELYKTLYMMYYESDVIKNDYGTLTKDELLNDFKQD